MPTVDKMNSRIAILESKITRLERELIEKEEIITQLKEMLVPELHIPIEWEISAKMVTLVRFMYNKYPEVVSRDSLIHVCSDINYEYEDPANCFFSYCSKLNKKMKEIHKIPWFIKGYRNYGYIMSEEGYNLVKKAQDKRK
jgi:DNA-binding response OmpR family regulator